MPMDTPIQWMDAASYLGPFRMPVHTELMRYEPPIPTETGRGKVYLKYQNKCSTNLRLLAGPGMTSRSDLEDGDRL